MVKINSSSFNGLLNINSNNPANNIDKLSNACRSVSFEQKDNIALSVRNDCGEKIRNKKDKIGTSVMSFFVPGSGQFMKNENNKAAAMLSSSLALFSLNTKTVHPRMCKLSFLALNTYSAYDAYKD